MANKKTKQATDKKKAKRTKNARGQLLTKATTTRIQKLLAKHKLSYREIAERCNVSAPTVGRLARATRATTGTTSPQA